MCSRLLAREATNIFFSLLKYLILGFVGVVRVNFFFLFVTGTGPGGLNPFYSCFFTVDLENIFLRSQTLFKKVAVKRCFWYIVAAKACFYKTAKQFFTSAGTLRFFAYLDFVPAPTKFGRLLMYAILKWPIT